MRGWCAIAWILCAAGCYEDPVSAPCAQTCDGCCDGETCSGGTDDTACGAEGGVCMVCQGSETCVDGACTEPTTCATTCAGCCDGETCVAGDSPQACGTGGEACVSCGGLDDCEAGMCMAPACSAASCDGCCDGDVCRTGTADDACGVDGATCDACGGGATCQLGACVESGDHLWSVSFGELDASVSPADAAASGDQVVVVGWHEGGVDFGGGLLMSTSSSQFLVKLDAAGDHVWSRQYLGIGADACGFDVLQSVRIDGAGAVVAGGWYCGAIAPLGLDAGDTQAGVVIKLSSAGALSWARNVGTSYITRVLGVDVDAANAVFVAGRMDPEAQLGGSCGTLTTNGQADGFLAKYNATGDCLWAVKMGGTSSDTATYVAVAPSGDVVVHGHFHSSNLNLGGGNLPQHGGVPDFFVAKLTSTGAHVWSRSFGSPAFEVSYGGLVVDGAGSVYVAGNSEGTIDFGGGPRAPLGDTDGFLVKLDAAGNHVWSIRVGTEAYDHLANLKLDATGRLLVSGTLQGDCFLGAHDPATGLLVDEKRYGPNCAGAGVAVLDDGSTIWTGTIIAPGVSVGGDPLPYDDNVSMFVARYAP